MIKSDNATSIHAGPWIGVAPALYSVLTIGVVGIDAYWRHRLPIIPFACAYAGYGVWTTVRQRIEG